MKNILRTFILLALASSTAFAGNPDRQGEAGAVELLMNPWARSAGLHSLNTAGVTGVESMRINIAGLSRGDGSELAVGYTRYFEGTGISLNSAGFSNQVGENGAFGISIMAMSFGDIPVTTTAQPEGTGGTYSPNFFHLGIGYSHSFDGKISVGALLRVISESAGDVSTGGIALDAGVQYFAGENDQFKLGISIRNLGTKLRFGGEGLTFDTQNPEVGENELQLAFLGDAQADQFQLPSVLNMGLSYDFMIGSKHRVTAVGNFTSNAFSRDQLGVGVEYSLNEQFALRGGYRVDLDDDQFSSNIYDGLSAGASITLPMKDDGRGLSFDYAWRATNTFNGTHNFGLRLAL